MSDLVHLSSYLSNEMRELKESMIRSLREQGVLKSKIIEEALRAVPREEFLWPGEPRFLAYVDEPRPLGESGQTISAPHMVVIMLEELELKEGLKVLEIGTGSGYNSALIGWIVSGGKKEFKKPLVVSVERDERLVAFAKRNVAKVGLSNVVDIVLGDGSLGYPQGSKNEIYDRIIVTAGAPRVPVFLKHQLKTGGIIEAPVGGAQYQELVKLRKRERTFGGKTFEESKIVECMFVPLVGEDAH